MSSCFLGEVRSTSLVLPILMEILFAFNQFAKFANYEKILKCYMSLHRKWSFPLRISSVNMTKSAGICEIQRDKRGPSMKTG